MAGRRKAIKQDASDWDDFTPEYLLRSDELKLVVKLLRTDRRLTELWRAGGYTLPPKQKALREAAQAELGALAHAVLKRVCGIDRLMVVRVSRADGFQTSLQVMSFDLIDRFASYQLAWSLSGPNLRKDGFVGSRWGYTAFRAARIDRRRLDDTWQHLAPRYEPAS